MEQKIYETEKGSYKLIFCNKTTIYVHKHTHTESPQKI